MEIKIGDLEDYLAVLQKINDQDDGDGYCDYTEYEEGFNNALGAVQTYLDFIKSYREVSLDKHNQL